MTNPQQNARYEAWENLVDAAEVVAVLGEGGGFLFIPLGPGVFDGDILRDAIIRGYHYCGSLALNHGHVVICDSEDDADSLKTLHAARQAFILRHIHQLGKGDALGWLEKLHSLEDRRNAH